jgi:hypothetical protein
VPHKGKFAHLPHVICLQKSNRDVLFSEICHARKAAAGYFGRPPFSSLSQAYRENSFSQPPLKVYKSSEKNYDGGSYNEIKHADPGSWRQNRRQNLIQSW